MIQKVLIEVDALVWGRVKERASAEGRFVKALVGEALERYLSGGEASRGAAGAGAAVGPVSRGAVETGPLTVETLKALVNGVKPGAVQTARELMQAREAREARRGDIENESQDPRDRGDDSDF